MAIVVEIFVCVLMSVTIFYCVILNRKLNAFKNNHYSLKKSVDDVFKALTCVDKSTNSFKQNFIAAQRELAQKLEASQAISLELEQKIASAQVTIERAAVTPDRSGDHNLAESRDDDDIDTITDDARNSVNRVSDYAEDYLDDSNNNLSDNYNYGGDNYDDDAEKPSAVRIRNLRRSINTVLANEAMS